MVDLVFKCVAVLLTLISSYLTASWLSGIPAGLTDSIVMGFVGVIFTVCMVTFPGVGLRVRGAIGFGMLLCGIGMLGLSVFASYERLDSGYASAVESVADRDSQVVLLESRLSQLNHEIEIAMNTAALDADSGYRARSLKTQQTILPKLKAEAAEVVESIKHARGMVDASGTIPSRVRVFVYLIVSVLIDLCAQLVILFLLFSSRNTHTHDGIESMFYQSKNVYFPHVDNGELESYPGVLTEGQVNEKYVFRNRVSQNRLEKDFGRDKAKAIIQKLIDLGRVGSDKSIIKAA